MKKIFTFLTAMLVGLSAWAGEVTFTPGEFEEVTNGDYSLTKDGVTISVGASTVTAEQFRIFKGQTLTVSSASGNMTKIEFTCTASGTTKYGPGCFAAQDGYNYVESIGTWEGSAQKVSFTASSAQVRATEIVVTVGDEPVVVEPEQNDGTLEKPYTVAEASAVALQLESGSQTDASFYVKGKISQITYTFSSNYGTATFSISEDGSTTAEFLCYSVYYLENKPWVDGYKQIAVGDEVIVYGQLTNYNGIPETASRKAYIYSLNGQTELEEQEDPEPELILASIADFNAAEESTNVWYQLTGIVKNLKDGDQYGNFDLEDETGSVYVYGLLSEKGGEKKLFQELVEKYGIQNGSKLTIIGNRGSYKNKIEVINAYFVSVEMTPTAIETVKAEQNANAVYNLQGQRVQNAVKGLYIVGGKKVLF